MAITKWSEQKEEHLEHKNKICQLKKRWQLWKLHFKNHIGNSHKVTDKPITKIINGQLEIKLEQFIELYGLNEVPTKIKSRKAAGVNEIPTEVWKTRKSDDLLFRFCNTVYKQNTKERWTKNCLFFFSQKGDLRIIKNYSGITLTTVVAKIYNILRLNSIKPKIEKILGENQNSFRRNRSVISQILTVHRIIEGVCAKISW